MEKDYLEACCPDYELSTKVKALYKLPRCIRHGIVGIFNRFVDLDFDGAEEGTVKWWNIKTKYCPAHYIQTAEIEFEGKKYKAPADYDSALTLLYGDYMTPPSENEREGHELFQGETIRDLQRDYREYQNELKMNHIYRRTGNF